MAENITRRLENLRVRRRGTDRLYAVDSNVQLGLLAKSTTQEGWQKRALNRPYTQYALGAMEAVDADYTRISIETAERVGRQLEAGLLGVGIHAFFRLQGSVPLDIHIKGVSDVDLLTLRADFLTYATFGSRTYQYTSSTTRTSLQVLQELRASSERILRSKYPAADIDCSGAKAIKLSGGSLARPVDVVPAHWWDCVAYQASQSEADRGVTILDGKRRETLDNYPFKHIALVNLRDQASLGGVKKAIRLCKNVKSDAIEDGKKIDFPSFDIASAMYHADLASLRIGYIHNLAILSETQRYLDWLTINESEAQKLKVPDGSRYIFDSRAKLDGLRTLSIEMDALSREAARELGYSGNELSVGRRFLTEALIPAA